MHEPFNRINAWIFVIFALTLTSCASQQSRMRSSVVDYLYPKQGEVVIQPATPELTIPLQVGIAFVPEQRPYSKGMHLWPTGFQATALSETRKSELLGKVADHFKRYPFVSDIEIIPSAYLFAGGSFSNLDQIRTMYGVDVIALVSYDQVQFTDQGALSLTYWTLVGAYIFSGEKNDTTTMMDTAVYDIASRKMLFRAPGTSSVKGRATPVNLNEQLRSDSLKGFTEATDNMIANLDVELSNFKEKIKQQPQQVRVVTRPGYSDGGGAFGLPEALLMLTIYLFLLARPRRTP